MPDDNERCWATGCTLPFQKGSNAFSLGVNGLVLQTEKYNQKKDHDIVVPVYQWANCRQSVCGPSGTKTIIIPSLREAYVEMYRQMIVAYQTGHEEMAKRGDAQSRLMKAHTDFGGMVYMARDSDKKKGLHNNMTTSRLFDMVRAHHAICSTSGILMTSYSASDGVRGPYDVHMDRINDGFSATPEGHVDTNIELKCRLFSNDQFITRKDFLLVFLNQLLVPLSERVRALAQAEYDAIPCSPRDAWKHEVKN
jgi:hypothetical protein